MSAPQFRVITPPRNIISGQMFVGILLIIIGLSWFVGIDHLYGLSFYTSFDIMFGALLLAHGLLKRGHPYRIGKVGTFLGALFLAIGAADYYGKGAYGWAVLFVLIGVLVVVWATTRRW